MDHAELATLVEQRCRLTGHFVLRSGIETDTYFDKYRFEADPVLLREVAAAMVDRIPSGTEVLAGLEMGGIPVATALSLATGLPAVFVRKQAKGYGTAKLAEGPEIEGKQLLVVEDVITTGGQVVLSTEDLRGLGAKVDNVLCAIDRSGGNHDKLEAIGLKLDALFTFTV